MQKGRNALRAAAICLAFVCFFFMPACALGAVSASDWTWDILVVPPDEGWDGETGKSVHDTLLWHRAAIS